MQQPIIGIIGYCNQECALELTGQESPINRDYRPTMFEIPFALTKGPERTAKYSHGCTFISPCLRATWLHLHHHARISCRHRSQQPRESVISFLPITIQHFKRGLLDLPCLPTLHRVTI